MTATAAARDTFEVFGTTAVLLVTAPAALSQARALADAELAAVDLACSRFRPDSELTRLNQAGGAARPASPLFADLIATALRAARLTDGLVDPTCGQALIDLGYDRDFEQVAGAQAHDEAPIADESGRPKGGLTHRPPGGPGARRPRYGGFRGVSPRASTAPPVRGVPGGLPPGKHLPGWGAVELDQDSLLVRLRHGALLDLGATAKARAADRCAALIAGKLGCGVLVSLGGDIAVAGPAPAGGWRVRVTDDHAAGPDAPGQTVAITDGGLATSSTTVRTWAAGGEQVHHIIDPATGRSARSCWRTVSVTAGSCVDANTASTAAIIRGTAAPDWLRDCGLAARLVRADGTVQTTGGWPAERRDGPAPR